MLVIASVVIVSVLAWAVRPLMSAMILNPFRVRERKQVHRLLTAGFVHADGAHLLFNMITLWFFANHVVRALGETKFLVLYLSAVVVGFLPTVVRHAKNPKYNSLGASGAVAAVMFAAILLVPHLRLSPGFLPVAMPGLLYALFYLAYSAWHSWRSRDGINHDAHFSGAIWGALFTFVVEPARVQRTLSQLL
jgi:membrane associated rhomboid family serine protease